MNNSCKTVGCSGYAWGEDDFCGRCKSDMREMFASNSVQQPMATDMAKKYPQYYKQVGTLTEIDVYAVHYLFDIQDPSGAIQHASKKLLLSGARTGGKSALKDIKEARDTLTRYIQLHESAP